MCAHSLPPATILKPCITRFFFWRILRWLVAAVDDSKVVALIVADVVGAKVDATCVWQL